MPSLDVGLVVEERGQLDAAVAELREAFGVVVARVQVRSGVVGREEHQGREEVG